MPPPTAGGQGCLLGELADHGGDVGDSRAQVSVGAKVEDRDLLGGDPYPPVGTLRRWRGRTLRPAPSAKHSRTRSTFRPLTLQSTVTYRTWGPSDGCTVQLRCGQPPDVVVPAEVGHPRVDALQPGRDLAGPAVGRAPPPTGRTRE